ncbi:MAG: hypothetical protein CMM34_04700 [Rhodospirillaceae bacterium]|nr:hypothetical protein [Rhodospirillaceae bacterium]
MRILIPFVVLGSLFAAYSAFWLYLSHAVKGQVVELQKRWSSEGIHVTHRNLSVEGFPYRLTLKARGVQVSQQDGRFDWSWEAPFLYATAHPWQLSHWVVNLESSSELSLTLDAEFLLRAIVGSGRISFIGDADGFPIRASFDLENMVLQSDQFYQQIDVGGIEVHVRRLEDTNAGVDAAILVNEVYLGDGNVHYLDASIQGIVAEMSFKEPLPDSWDRLALAEWRDDGGVVELPHFRVVWGALDLQLDGTFSLDEAFRPIGAANVAVKGYQSLLEVLLFEGAISESVAVAVGLGLDILAEPIPEEDVRLLKAPVTIQDGYLSVGGIPLVPVGPIIPP